MPKLSQSMLTSMNTAATCGVMNSVNTFNGNNPSHILNTPNEVFCLSAFNEALRESPRTLRVSAGSMTPSSHNLLTNKHKIT